MEVVFDLRRTNPRTKASEFVSRKCQLALLGPTKKEFDGPGYERLIIQPGDWTISKKPEYDLENRVELSFKEALDYWGLLAYTRIISTSGKQFDVCVKRGLWVERGIQVKFSPGDIQITEDLL